MSAAQTNVIIQFEVPSTGHWLRSGNVGTTGTYSASAALRAARSQPDRNFFRYRTVRVGSRGKCIVLNIIPLKKVAQ